MIPAVIDQFSRLTLHRLILITLCCFIILFTPVSQAQEATDAEAEAEAALQKQVAEFKALDEAGKEEKIAELAITLTDRKGFDDAFELLNALGDIRVKRLYEAIEGRDVLIYEERPVVFVEEEDEEGNDWQKLYPLLGETQWDDKQIVPQSPMIARIKKGDGKRYRLRTKNRRAVLKALQIIDLRLDSQEIRLEATIKLGTREVVEAYPELVRLMENDPVAVVRQEAEESVHILRLRKSEEVEADLAARLNSIKRLGELDSIRGGAKLEEILKENADEQDEAFGKLSPEELQAIESALAKIDRHITITSWIKHFLNGISSGTIFILLALGLAITFGIMGVINMAHGEMLMIGAVSTWACFEYLTSLEWLGKAFENYGLGEYYYVAALPISFIVAAFAGWLTEITIVRHLYKRPLDSMLATIGVSLLLIQAVRLWKGDNLGLKAPTYMSGSVELFHDISFPIFRIFILILCVACVVSVFYIMRFTRMGLLIRATVQNRDMARSLGVNTRLVDMFTFSLGAGLAGLAGYGLATSSPISPRMGQGYIVEAFLVTVVGGVGNLLGVIISGLSIGSALKLIEPLPYFDAGYTKAFVLLLVVIFITLKPQGLFPHKGRKTNTSNESEMPWLAKPSKTFDWSMGIFLAGLGLLVVPILYWQGYISAEFVSKLGWMATFALCAIGLDLIWGYMGALSLAQFMFFGLGAYAMALYLVNHGPMVVNTLPNGTVMNVPESLSVVSSSVDGPIRPWFLDFFMDFHWAILFAMLIPGLLAFIIGLAIFRSRVTGVYFAILTQAITVGLMTVMEKSDLLMGGTTGLYNYNTVLGQEIAGKMGAEGGTLRSLMSSLPESLQMTRFWWYIASILVLLTVIIIMKLLMSSGFGRVLIAIRDDETRLRFCGYKTWIYKTAAFTLAAVIGGIAGAMYVPHQTTVTPSFFEPGASILIVVLVALGGRSTIWGPVIGAFAVLLLKDTLSSSAPPWYVDACSAIDFVSMPLVPDGSWLLLLWSADGWPLVLGALFVLVTLLLPGGLMSVPSVIMAKARSLGKKHNSSNIPDAMIDAEVKA